MSSSEADLPLQSSESGTGAPDDARRAPSMSAGLVFLLATAVALGPLAIDVYLPAFSAIADTFGVGLPQVQVTLSVFLAGTAVGQALYGPITDRWGRRQPLLWGLAVFALSAAACALSQNIGAMILARAFMALGASAGMVISRAVVRDRCEVHEMAKVFSLLMLIMGAAPVLAPSIGGLLLNFVGWRGIFWMLAISAVLCFAATSRWLPESLPVSRRSRGGLGKALLTYRSLLVNPWFMLHSLIAGATAFALFGYVSSAPAVFIEQHGVSPQAFSILFGANAVSLFGCAQLNRLFLRWWSPRRVLIGATTVHFVAALGLLATVLTGTSGLATTEIALLFSLGTVGIIFPNVGALVLAPFAALAGSASALQGSIQFALGAIAGAAIGMLHDGTALPLGVVLTIGSGMACAFTWWSGRLWGNLLPAPQGA